MVCPNCGSEELRKLTTECPNTDDTGETLAFWVCPTCDYGINDHTEGECDCARDHR